MLNKTIAFIGPGAMAEAMIGGLIRQKLAEPPHLLVSGPRSQRVELLKEKYGVQPFTDNSAAASLADVVVLSVKPQRLTGVMKALKGIKPEALGPPGYCVLGQPNLGINLPHGSPIRT